MNEIFKEITIDETHFQVGNMGTIYRNGVPANIIITPDGYHQVSCRHRSIGVHRLVAMCFVDGRTEDRNEVNHKDYDRTNNRADNLEWMTHADNVRYSACNHTASMCGENNPNWGNTKLSKFYAENPDIAREKQGRPGARNGMAKPVDVYRDGNFLGHFDYVGACWEFLRDNYGYELSADALRLGIRRAIARESTYHGYTFVTQNENEHENL